MDFIKAEFFQSAVWNPNTGVAINLKTGKMLSQMVELAVSVKLSENRYGPAKSALLPHLGSENRLLWHWNSCLSHFGIDCAQRGGVGLLAPHKALRTRRQAKTWNTSIQWLLIHIFSR